MPLDLLFPTTVFRERVDSYEDLNKSILPHIEQLKSSIPSGGDSWIGSPYNTCGTWDISKDDNFKKLTESMTILANEYQRHLGVNINRDPVAPQEAWLNIYEQGHFQEYHHHASFKISGVYYVEVPENASEIIFESPLEPDMLPLRTFLHSGITDTRARYSVETGDAIFFRSYLRHCVPPMKVNGRRISIAFNFL